MAHSETLVSRSLRPHLGTRHHTDSGLAQGTWACVAVELASDLVAVVAVASALFGTWVLAFA